MTPRNNFREAALERGADELMNLVEWTLRDRPRALANAKAIYVRCCLDLYRRIARSGR